MVSESAVEPIMSQNMVVMCRRSPAASASPALACAGCSARPHALQNLAGAAYSIWHWGQRQELCGSDEANGGSFHRSFNVTPNPEWRQSYLTRDPAAPS